MFGPEVRSVLRRRGVVVAWLFGSQADGTSRPGSDIDLALLSADGAPPMDLLELAGLAGELEGHLGAPIDLIDLRRAPLELRARVVLTATLVHSDDEVLRVRTVVETQSRWEDVRPALREMDRAYLAAVARRGLLATAPSGRS